MHTSKNRPYDEDLPFSGEPQKASDCFGSTTLKFIVERAKQISQSDNILNKLLPDEVKPHCAVLNIEEQTLIVAVQNAAWATRIRYLAPTLLMELKKHASCRDLKAIRCRVRSK